MEISGPELTTSVTLGLKGLRGRLGRGNFASGRLTLTFYSYLIPELAKPSSDLMLSSLQRMPPPRKKERVFFSRGSS